MGINADLRDAMISLYEAHKGCITYYGSDECNVGTEFMQAMESWINQ